MRLLGILAFGMVLISAMGVLGEEIALKLNQKEVDISGKVEKFYSLFPDPPLEIKINGLSKLKFIARKIIDKKNPLTKLPVTVTIHLDNNKIKEILLNDRDGTAVIKDATMFNAGEENSVEFDVPSGEHTLKISTTKSAIKGLLIRLEKIGEEKLASGKTPAPPVEKKEEKEFVPPIIPPLVPLVPPAEGAPVPTQPKEEPKAQAVGGTPPPQPQKPIEAEKKGVEEKPVAETSIPKKPEVKSLEPVQTVEKPIKKERGFGDIVLFSLKGGVFLPLDFGNPGGYGEFSTSFNLYKGLLIGASLASYNSNRDYIVNDPYTGNFVLKYHLHAVPLSGFIGYKYQMKEIFTKFEINSGVNMVDIDIRRKYASEKADTINSFMLGFSAELSYILKYGSIGMGVRYIYSISNNIEKDNGFVKDLNSGGVIITAGYHYGF